MVDISNNKRTVRLANYSITEGLCRCGCGFGPTERCLIAHQAFHDALERKFGRKIRHLITGPARCKAHNEALIKSGEKAAKDSRHVYGEALDGRWYIEIGPGKWEQIDYEIIAQEAIKSGLFGGVGYKTYAAAKKNLVHLDVRMGGEIDIW